jgi:hypothetical protein
VLSFEHRVICVILSYVSAALWRAAMLSMSSCYTHVIGCGSMLLVSHWQLLSCSSPSCSTSVAIIL